MNMNVGANYSSSHVSHIALVSWKDEMAAERPVTIPDLRLGLKYFRSQTIIIIATPHETCARCPEFKQ